jgi:HSP20 family protein
MFIKENRIINQNNLASLSRIADHLLHRAFSSDAAENMNAIPSANISENQEAFVIDLLAPGFQKEDFNLLVENDLLVVSAKKTTTDQTSQEQAPLPQPTFLRQEFSTSSLSRSFKLTNKIDTTKIKANYQSGILNIELPKREEAKTANSFSINVN